MARRGRPTREENSIRVDVTDPDSDESDFVHAVALSVDGGLVNTL